MKYYGKVGHIWEPVLKQNFYFLCSTPDYCVGFLKRQFKIQSNISYFAGKDGRCLAYEKKNKTGSVLLIWVCSFKIPVILHEINHAVHYALRERNVGRNEELFCYYAGYLASEIFKNKKVK